MDQAYYILNRAISENDVSAPQMFWGVTTWDGEDLNDLFYTNSPCIYPIGEIVAPTSHRGQFMDYTNFNIPIVSSELGEYIENIVKDDILRIPVRVNGIDRKCDIMIVRKVIECLDLSKSRIDWEHDANTNERRIRRVHKMRIAIDRVDGCNIFRVKGNEFSIVVSEKLMNALEDSGFTGFNFEAV